MGTGSRVAPVPRVPAGWRRSPGRSTTCPVAMIEAETMFLCLRCCDGSRRGSASSFASRGRPVRLVAILDEIVLEPTRSSAQ